VDIYKLPTGILSFIQEAQTPDYRAGWQEIRRRAWPKPKLGKKDALLAAAEYEPSEEKQMQLSNRFFNDLFNLPRESGKFVRIYFLRTLYDLLVRSGDWTPQQVGQNRAKVRGIGQVTVLFMEEVLSLDAQRISDIKQLADRLAQICKDDSPRFRQLMQVRRNWAEVRKVLRQISRRETENGRAPLLSLDQFLSIFEMSDDNEYVDWALAWDLVLIRLMETLYKLDPDFFKKNPTPTAEELDEDGTNQVGEAERVPVAV
jgi:CRISPR-associated protein Cst1